MESVTILLISSGMDISKLRSPASTCAIGIWSFLAVMEHAKVEFTSPTTITRSGRSWIHTSSNAVKILAVCRACVHATTHAEKTVRFSNAQLFEKDLAHFPVVVLASMDDLIDKFFSVFIQFPCDGGNFHEIWPGTTHEENFFRIVSHHQYLFLFKFFTLSPSVGRSIYICDEVGITKDRIYFGSSD